MEWDLDGLHSGRTELIATLDVESLLATGSPIAPQLHFPLVWKEPHDSTQWNAEYRVLAVSLELHSPGPSTSPLVQTGLIPQLRSGQRLLCLPLSQPIIEDLCHKAGTANDNDVWLHLAITVMGRPSTREEGSTASGTNSEIAMYGTSSPRSFRVTALQWSKFLATWGYPSVRFVAMPIQLPARLRESNTNATALWDHAIQALMTIHGTWREQGPSHAGQELRTALLFAALAWDALWHPEEPSQQMDLNKALMGLGTHIPGWDKRPFYITDDASPNTKRVISWLLLLRDLNLLVNPLYHRGVKPVYSSGDVEALVTSVTAVLRALPAFWEEFPSPEAIKG